MKINKFYTHDKLFFTLAFKETTHSISFLKYLFQKYWRSNIRRKDNEFLLFLRRTKVPFNLKAYFRYGF